MKIYRYCTSKPYSFLAIDTTLPVNNPLQFTKKSFRFLTKNTLTDEIKILDDKIKANQAQYYLGREAANFSALLSKELDKYEYLTGKDLGYKAGGVEQAKFEYLTLYKDFDKGLIKYEKENGILERLTHIEDKNKEQLQEIEGQGERLLNMINKQGKKHLEKIEKEETQLKKSKIRKKLLVKKVEKEEKLDKAMSLKECK